MTENEALKRMKMCIGVSPSENIISSFKLMSDALDELQQYRAIGTPEYIVKMIDEQLGGLDILDVLKRLTELEQYRAIGTVEEFKALKEKNFAKKPIRSDLCTCPSCGTHNDIIKKRRNTVTFDTVYCWHCGQAMEIRRGADHE